MEWDAARGASIARTYLSAPEHADRLRHTGDVARFAGLVGRRIAARHPALLSPTLIDFLAWTHDIGYARNPQGHELHTITMLVEDGVPDRIARKTLHGPHRPVCLEGVVLTYADMSVRFWPPVSVEERAAEIIARTRTLPIDAARKDAIIRSVSADLPRFTRYERACLSLAGVSSYQDF